MNLTELLVEAVRSAAKVNRSLMVPPAAILWTDADRIWESAIPQLAKQLPELFVLGDYAPEVRQGPSIWLKCAVAGKLGTQLPGGTVPILYLPGTSRADLRAIETCPRELQPLAELQYRGVFWSQVNGKDWTVNAFLSAKKGGLGLDVAQDSATQEALRRVLAAGMLLDRQVEDLQGKPISAAWLDALLAPNPTRDVLAWLNDPTATQSKMHCRATALISAGRSPNRNPRVRRTMARVSSIANPPAGKRRLFVFRRLRTRLGAHRHRPHERRRRSRRLLVRLRLLLLAPAFVLTLGHQSSPMCCTTLADAPAKKTANASF